MPSPQDMNAASPFAVQLTSANSLSVVDNAIQVQSVIQEHISEELRPSAFPRGIKTLFKIILVFGICS